MGGGSEVVLNKEVRFVPLTCMYSQTSIKCPSVKRSLNKFPEIAFCLETAGS